MQTRTYTLSRTRVHARAWHFLCDYETKATPASSVAALIHTGAELAPQWEQTVGARFRHLAVGAEA